MYLKKIITGVLISLFIVNTAIAASSTNYTIDVDELNSGGTLQTSANYKMNSTIVGFVDGYFGNSANYTLGSGLVYLEQLCGNGILEFGETCDDGNTLSGDGCNNLCSIEALVPICGNGIVESGEQCDDGNTTSGDGCSSICSTEAIPTPGGGGVIKFLCGNGIKDPSEQCDDGNNLSGDGCSSVCALEKPEMRQIKIKARPEKRVNPTQNWGTQAQVSFYGKNGGGLFLTATVNIDNSGWGSLATDQLPDGSYDIGLKGLSHLTKIMRNQAIDSESPTLDFTFRETFYLLAGDVHGSKDDFINALDITATVKALYSSDIHADLNHDGIINSLDIGITVNNLYKTGESF